MPWFQFCVSLMKFEYEVYMAKKSRHTAAFLRLPQVLTRIPISRSRWWAGIQEGKYPRGVKLSARTTAWRLSDIDDLVERLSRGEGGDV
jgi:predicted DNA-binding transcriptional regulator AlpA